MQIKCYYSVVRYVPNDLRDEAVNVGVLLQSDSAGNSASCLSAFSGSWSRAARLDPSPDKQGVARLLDTHTKRLAEQAQKLSLPELVRRYSGGRIQLTSPRFSLAYDLHEELSQLKQQFIVAPEAAYELGCTIPRLRHDVKELLKLEIPKSLGKIATFAGPAKPLLYAGKKGEHPFDLRLKSPVHTDLVRYITFDVKGYSDRVNAAKILAWDAEDVKAQSSRSTAVLSVIYPPKLYVNGSLKAFSEAQIILAGEGIPVYDFSKSSDRIGLVTIAQKRLAEAGAS